MDAQVVMHYFVFRVCTGWVATLFLFVFFILANSAFSQVNRDVSERGSGRFSRKQESSATSDSFDKTLPKLKHVVKIVFDSNSNMITLIGAQQDIETVRDLIRLIDLQTNANLDRCTEKVRLNFQQAEAVVEILSAAKQMEGSGFSRLQFSALHFPESILLIGPTASVERAKKLIETVDSHPGFESDRK